MPQNPGKADQVAAKIANIDWQRIQGQDGKTSDMFYAVVRIGEVELARIQISRQDYVNDHSIPAESKAKRFRAEIAKILRQEYPEG